MEICLFSYSDCDNIPMTRAIANKLGGYHEVKVGGNSYKNETCFIKSESIGDFTKAKLISDHKQMYMITNIYGLCLFNLSIKERAEIVNLPEVRMTAKIVDYINDRERIIVTHGISGIHESLGR